MAVKTNYLLIDYENVQPTELSLLDGIELKVLVFLGANQTKVPVEFVKAIQTLGNKAEYIQISGNGPNALDFHIAFTIGELSKSDPGSVFHIISKDTGFDPLIRHAKGKGIRIKRSKSIADIPLNNNSNAQSSNEKITAIVKNLKARGTSRPRKVKTLSNSINSQFSKSLKQPELKSLIQALEKNGHLSIEGENVSYFFSKKK
jgi:hypothetical protein